MTDAATPEQLAVGHLEFARTIARQYARRCPRLADDFEGAAMIGLWDAARKFDPGRGCRFTTYAGNRIAGAVLDFARGECPVGSRRAAGKAFRRRTVGLVTDRHADDPAWEPAYEPRPYGEDADAVWELTRGLTRREREVVAAVYGGRSGAEVARGLGLHPSRVTQILAAAVRFLRSRSSTEEVVVPKTTEAASAARRGKPRPPAKTRSRPRDYLSVGEVVRACGAASPRTVVSWCDKGLLPCIRLPDSGDRRVRRADLAAFLRAHGMGPEADRLEGGGG
jgi:RNA polymerase sigma factor (sigma-70 family)